MPAVAFNRAFFPTLVNAALGNRDGVHGEFLEFSDQTTPGPPCLRGGVRHPTSHERSPRPSASMVACSSRPGSPSEVGDFTTGQWTGGHQAPKVAISADAIEGALLDHDARIHVELALLIRDPRCRPLRGAQAGGLFQSSLEGLVEHNGLQGMDGHELQVGGKFSKSTDMVVGFESRCSIIPSLKSHPTGRSSSIAS